MMNFKILEKVCFITVFALLVFCQKNSFAVNPSYNLKATNIVQTEANSLEFDIYIIHTNPDSSIFEYATGQYYFDFNSLIANGGIFSYSIINSDLPPELQPRNPIVYLVGGAMQLRLSANPLPSPGNGYIISGSLPGTKIIRMRLQTSAKAFDTRYFTLRWRNGPTNPFTKIYSYVDAVYTEITTSANHLIDSLDHPLPVEMQSFSFEVFKNNVNLYWTTLSELNNKSFDIERKASDGVWINTGNVHGNGTVSTVSHYVFLDKKLPAGIYSYRLRQNDFNGNFSYYYLNDQVVIQTPSDYFVSGNYPNPFNPVTNIDFHLPADSRVTVKLYDVRGVLIKEILNENKQAGYYSLKINSNDLSSGIYFYHFSAVNGNSGYNFSGKMILNK